MSPPPDNNHAARSYTEAWCKTGVVAYVELPGGARVRYLRVGSGPPLLLLHTVRTQLDHFQLVVPQLTQALTVYAVDLPGMGWSDIQPGASHDEPALRASVVGLVNRLDLSDVSLAGESMGATLSLTAAPELGDRLRRVVAFNTYDFPDGIKRANLLARGVVGAARLPALGPIVARLENKADPEGRSARWSTGSASPPDHYLDELRRVGRRPGYPAVARAVFRTLESLIAARRCYSELRVPVTLVYGDHDWSRPSDRQANLDLVPEARGVTPDQTGHFAALERPADVARILLGTD